MLTQDSWGVPILLHFLIILVNSPIDGEFFLNPELTSATFPIFGTSRPLGSAQRETRGAPWLCFLLGKVWWNFWALFNHGPDGQTSNSSGFCISFAVEITKKKDTHRTPKLWLDPVPLISISRPSVASRHRRVIEEARWIPFSIWFPTGRQRGFPHFNDVLIMVVSIRSHDLSSMKGKALVSGDCGQAEVGAAAINFGFKNWYLKTPYSLVPIELVIQVKLNHMPHMPYDEMK